MKTKLLFGISTVLLPLQLFSQTWTAGTGTLYVDPSSTKVGIGTTNPLSLLSVGSDGSSITSLYSKKSGTGNCYGIYGIGESSTTGYTIGVRGDARYVSGSPSMCFGVYGYAYFPTPQSNGRSYGVVGFAGNATTGWNRAIQGVLMGSNNGAAVYGITPSYAESAIDGIYAGYFLGNVYVAGNLGIGCTNPTVKLAVNGKIQASDLEITTTPCSDYVFEKDYKLLSLSEVEKYVNIHKHLPEVPSAKEFQKGYSIGKMDDLLLRKIEEITLYLIELKKENHDLKNKLEKFETLRK